MRTCYCEDSGAAFQKFNVKWCCMIFLYVSLMRFLKSKHFWGLFLCALLMRFPFLFTSTALWGPDVRTFKDEAIFLYQGREVLQGYLPYERVWDNRSPFGWYLFALIYLLVGPYLWSARLLGIIIVALTGYILHMLASKHGDKSSFLVGYIYVIVCSTIQYGQSLSYDLVFALFFSLLLYLGDNFRDRFSWTTFVLIVWAICCHLLINTLIFGPLFALALASNKIEAKSFKQLLNKRVSFLVEFFRYGLLLLLSVVAVYAMFSFFYSLKKLDDIFWLAQTKLPAVIAAKSEGDSLKNILFLNVLNYLENSYTRLLNSEKWLLPVFVSLFPISILIRTLVRKKIPWRDCFILALLVTGLFAIGIRARPDSPTTGYLMQILPIICIAIYRAVDSRFVSYRLIAGALLICGLQNISMPIINRYQPFWDVLSAQKAWSEVAFNHPHFKIAEIINSYPKTSDYIYTCDEEAVVYLLTNRYTPTYILQAYLGYDKQVVNALGSHMQGYWRPIYQKSPQFIVGRSGAFCFDRLRKYLAKKYVQEANIGDYIIYRLSFSDKSGIER